MTSIREKDFGIKNFSKFTGTGTEIDPLVRSVDVDNITLNADGYVEVNAHEYGNFISDVSRGVVTGYYTIDKFGQNADVDIGTEDLWTGGGTWVAPTQARTHNIVSTSADDDGDPAGTGARTISITGVRADGTRQSETLTLNGTTVVPTANTYTMIDRMEILTVGATGSNVGAITATALVDTTVTARIEATYNQTRQCIFQIPTASIATLSSWYFNIGGASPAGTIITLQIQEKKNVANSPWVTKHIETYNSTNTSAVVHESAHYKKFNAGSYIRMRVTVDKNDTSVTGGFNLLITDN